MATVMMQDPTPLGDRENVDPGGGAVDETTMTMSLKDIFLEKTGQCQGILEEIFDKDEVMRLGQREELEAAMKDLLQKGYAKLKKPGKVGATKGVLRGDGDSLTPQEYYQGSAAILLAGLFQGDKPSSVIATLRDSLDAGKMEESLLSLVLNLRQGHPGLKLEKWENVLGLVSTIQSNVAVKGRLRDHSRNQLLVRSGQLPQQQPPQQLPTWGATKLSKSSLEAMWVIPLAYIVGYTVFWQREADPDSLVMSFDDDIRPRIDKLLAVAFPRLHPYECIDAGLLLLQLDLLEHAPSNTPQVLSIDGIVEKLQNQSVLKLMVSATDLPLFNFLARCAKVFISRLDKDDTERVVAACSQLMRKELATQYLSKLKATPHINGGDKNDNRLLTNSKGNDNTDLTDQRSHREDLLSSEFPILMYVETLLVSDKIDLAIDIVVEMEHCSSSLTFDNKIEGWRKIFRYLLQNGRLFLDGFPLGREEYIANRKLFLDKIVTRVGPIGLECLVDTYSEVLEMVAQSAGATSREEQIYVQRACHQTVLRILQAKHNEEQGLTIFQKQYWAAADKIVWSYGGLWPSLMLSSSPQERKKWADRLLCESNEVPVSMRLDGTLRPDITGLLNRREESQRKLPELYAASDGGLTEEAIEAAQENGRHANAAIADVVDVDMNDAGESCANEKETEATGNHVDDAVVLDDDDEEFKDANAEEQEAGDEEGKVDNDIVEIDDSDDDVDVDELLPPGKYDDADNESDDGTADEESVDKLLGGDNHEEDHHGESSEEERYSDDEDEEQAAHQAVDEPEVVDIDDDEDEEEETREEVDDDSVGGEDIKEIDVDDDNEAKEDADHDSVVAEETKEEIDDDVRVEGEIDVDEEEERKEEIDDDGSHTHDADMVETAASQSMDEAGSHTGYEPEDTQGFTEEEVSEAMHTEDEEEERQSAARMKQPRNESEEPEEEAPEPVQRLASIEAHTLSDMDYADEHTAEEEEDPGAESSELDEGDGAEALPPYADSRSKSWESGRGPEGGSSLLDFARRAQRHVDPNESSSSVPDATAAAPNAEPWHWAAGVAPPREQSGEEQAPPGDDTNAAHVGASSISFLEEGSLQASEAEVMEADESQTKVVVDHVPEGIEPVAAAAQPREESLDDPSGAPPQASVAGDDTNVAHVGASSVSFLEEGSLQALEVEVMEAESPTKVVVDHVPEGIEPVAAAAQPREESLDDPSEAPPQASVAGDDTNVARVGPSSVSFLEEGSLHASEAEMLESESPTKVVVDHVPEAIQDAARTDPDGVSPPRNDLETPASRHQQASVMGASFADTNAAHIGSASFAHSIDYAPTDEENDEDSPRKKVLVDCLPEAFESSPQKAVADDGRKPAAVTKQNDTLPAQEEEIDDAAVAAAAPSLEKELAQETPFSAEMPDRNDLHESDHKMSSPDYKEAQEGNIPATGEEPEGMVDEQPEIDVANENSAEEVVAEEEADAQNDVASVGSQEDQEKETIKDVPVDQGQDVSGEALVDDKSDAAPHVEEGEGVSTEELVADVEKVDEAADSHEAQPSDEAEAAKNDQTDDNDMDKQVASNEEQENDLQANNAEQQPDDKQENGADLVGAEPVDTVADRKAALSSPEPAVEAEVGRQTETMESDESSPLNENADLASPTKSAAKTTPEQQAKKTSITVDSANTLGGKSINVPTGTHGVTSPMSAATSTDGSAIRSPARLLLPVEQVNEASTEAPGENEAGAPKTARKSNRSKETRSSSPTAENSETSPGDKAEAPAEEDDTVDEEPNKATELRAHDSDNNLEDSNSPENEEHPVEVAEKANMETNASRHRADSVSDLDNAGSDDESEASPGKPPKRATRASARRKGSSKDEETESKQDEKEPPSSRRATRSRGAQKESTAATASPPRGRRTRGRVRQISESKQQDEDSGGEDASQGARRTTHTSKPKQISESKQNDGDSSDEDRAEPETHTRSTAQKETEEHSVASINTRRATRGRAKAAKKDEAQTGPDVEDQSVASSKNTRRSTRGRAKAAKKDEGETGPEVEEQSVASSKNSRRSTRARAKAAAKNSTGEVEALSDADGPIVANSATKPRRTARGGAKTKTDGGALEDESIAASTVSKNTRRSARGQPKTNIEKEGASEDDSAVASATRSTRRSARGKPKANKEKEGASEDDSAVASATRSTRRSARGQPTANKEATPDDASVEASTTSKSTRRSARGKSKANEKQEAASDEDSVAPSATKRTRRTTASQSKAKEEAASASKADDDSVAASSTRSTRRSTRKKAQAETPEEPSARGSRSRKRGENEDEGGEEDEGSAAGESSKSKSSARKKRKTAIAATTDALSLAPIPEDDTLTSPPTSKTTRKRKKDTEAEGSESKTKAKPGGKKAAKKAKTAAPDSDSDDDDDDEPIALIRARKKKGTENEDFEGETPAAKPKAGAKKTTRKTTAKSAAANADDDESVTSTTSSVRRSSRANKGRRKL